MWYFHHPDPSRWPWYYILAHCTGILSLTMPGNENVKTVTKNSSDIFGWMSPKGLIFQSTDQHLELFCTINLTIVEATNYTSSNLRFYKDGYLMDSHNETRVNKTTISLHLLNSHKSNHSYTCILNGNKAKLSVFALPDIRISGDEKTRFPVKNQDYGIPLNSEDMDNFQILVGSTQVIVGEKPKDVVNFRCYSTITHPDEIKCTWEIPKGPDHVNYTVYRALPDSSHEKGLALIPCTSLGKNQEYCFRPDVPMNDYNQLSNNFTIIAKNSFGENRQTFMYDKSLHFKPEIQEFSFLTKSSNFAYYKWLIPLTNAGRPMHLIFEICFKNNCKPTSTWYCSRHSEEIKESEMIVRTLHNFTEPKPNTTYEFRTRCKLSDAPEFAEYWSDYSVQTIVTLTLSLEEDIDLFRIFHMSNESRRMVDIFWVPQKYFHRILSIGVFEVDEKGRKKLVSDEKILKSFYISSSTLMGELFRFSIGPSAHCFKLTLETDEGDKLSKSIDIPAFNNELEFCLFANVKQYANDTNEYIWQSPKENLGNWSDNAVQTSATENISLFQIFHMSNESLRMVHIFWKPPTSFHHLVSINVSEVDKHGRKKLVPNEKRPESLNISFTPLMEEQSRFFIGPSAYNFVLTLETDEGDIISNSINIPALKNEVEFCPFFYVVQHADNTYEYIWQSPEEKLGIVNYTLFWQERQFNKNFPPIQRNMKWMYLSINQSKIPFNFGPRKTNDSIHYENEWDFYLGGNTKNSRSSLQKSMELMSSISDFWKDRILQYTREELNFLKKTITERSSKPGIDIGRKFSENQFHDWMNKLHGVEEPERCKGSKKIIRVQERPYKKHLFTKNSSTQHSFRTFESNRYLFTTYLYLIILKLLMNVIF